MGVVSWLVAIVALAVIAIVLWDLFETIVLPRRVSRQFRITRLVALTWWPVSSFARRRRSPQARERFLGPYGPLSLLVLLSTWGIVLITSFALLQWAAGSHLANPTGQVNFWTLLYMSGTTFFTLGLGDVTPLSPLARGITVVEAGLGFGILALVIGYLPILYQAFSRREVNISLLDARAGSPPTAVELLRRTCVEDQTDLTQFLRDWERWAAELLESHISYPQLAYFRSQHDNQSWLAAMTMILDACALIMSGLGELPPRSARLAFAITRHAAVDLSQVFIAPPDLNAPDRLPHEDFLRICAILRVENLCFNDEGSAEERLRDLRKSYEPYVNALSRRLLLDLPSWLPPTDAHDDWQTSIWEDGRRTLVPIPEL